MPAVCIASLGELLVEFVCTETDTRHLLPASYVGPFASGAPGIFIDQAARIAGAVDGRAVFAGAVGDDAFGRVILRRLAEDGVDTRLVRVVPGLPTGTAHVAYNADGSRDFVFNMAHSAAARLPDPDEIAAGFLAAGVTVLHISGSMLGDPAMRAAAVDVWRRLAGRGVALSIDPNIRIELMADAGYLDAVRRLMDGAAHVLPSDADADLLFPGEHFADWSARLLARGARTAVLKRGERGCIGRDAGGVVDLPAHKVAVVDPTGAGDRFCGTFVTLASAGQPLRLAMERANAAGALAVGRLGPMEGNTGLPEIDALRAAP